MASPIKIRSKPAVTVFDHISAQEAIKLGHFSLNKYFNFITDKEDVIQNYLLKLAVSTYNPAKSKPTTFCTMVARSTALTYLERSCSNKNPLHMAADINNVGGVYASMGIEEGYEF